MSAALRPGSGELLAGHRARPTGTVRLRDGSQVAVRFIRSDDGPRLIALFEGLSPETIYRRFLHARTALPPAEAARYAGVDGRERDALVACAPAPTVGAARIVAVARYAKEAEERAEGALVVDDAYQGLGLGTALLRRLITLLCSRGFRHLGGSVLTENGRMLRLLRATGHPLRIVPDSGAYATSLDLRKHPLSTSQNIIGDETC